MSDLQPVDGGLVVPNVTNVDAPATTSTTTATTTTTSLSVDQLESISMAATTSATISILGSLLLILMFCLGDKSRTKGARWYFGRKQMLSRFILCIALSDLVSAVAYFVGRRGSLAGTGSVLCSTQSFMEQWGDLASIFFTGSLAMNLVLILYFKHTAASLDRVEKFYFAANFGATFLIALFPMFMSSADGVPVYGADTLWCWITDEWQIFRFTLFYLPLWLIFIFNLVMYAIAGRELYRKAYRPPLTANPSDNHHMYSPEWPTPKYSETIRTATTTGTVDLSPVDLNAFMQYYAESPTDAEHARASHQQLNISRTDNDFNTVVVRDSLAVATIGDDSSGDHSQLSNAHELLTLHIKPQPPLPLQYYSSPTPAAAQPSKSCYLQPPPPALRLQIPHRRPSDNAHFRMPSPVAGAPSPTGSKLTVASSTTTTTTTRQLQKQAARTNYRTVYVQKVLIFLLAFLLTWSFATINRLQNYLHPNEPSFVLSLLQASTTPLRGFFNFVAYFVAGIWLAA